MQSLRIIVFTFFLICVYSFTNHTCERKEKKIVNIKMYGERNTGTNYLFGMLNKNFPNWNHMTGTASGSKLDPDSFFFLTESKNLGWKHRIAPHERELHHILTAKCVIFIYISKNPYAWLLSMHKHPYHYNKPVPGSFESFVRKPYNTAGKREHSNILKFSTPMALFNTKYKSYMSLPEPVIHIAYAQLLADPEFWMNKVKLSGEVECSYRLECQVANLENWVFKDFSKLDDKVLKSTGKKKVPIEEFKKKYIKETWKNAYLNPRWYSARHDMNTNKISNKTKTIIIRNKIRLVEFINQELDLDLVKALGYEIFDMKEALTGL